jgi:membrane-bound lytic murein transglycosylase B
VTTPVAPIATPDVPTTSPATSDWHDFLNQGLEAKFTMNELRAAGVVPDPNAPADQRFGLVDLQNGLDPTQYWIGGNNFFAITQYNRSFFYAMSVVELGRAIRKARGAY